MAAGEGRKQVSKGGNIISEVSWSGGTSQDVYYGIDHSFQYSANINCDDEMHGIKLATKPMFVNNRYKKCQLVSLGDSGVMALPIDTASAGDQLLLKRFQCNGASGNPVFQELNADNGTTYNYNYKTVPGVVFQDRFWFGYNKTTGDTPKGYIASVFCQATSSAERDQKDYFPIDHQDYTDESIESDDPSDLNPGVYMRGNITAILNYNNTRLVVAAGQDLWVYYPELDHGATRPDGGINYLGSQGWKRVLRYENGVTIVGLTCTFEYLKVWAVDEGWNTKIYYYQGNNNLRSTFVYNLVDLTGVRVLHVYSINGIDYYTSSLDGSDALIDFNKMIGATPVKLFSQRAGLDSFDVFYKSPYFVGPTSIGGAYNNGHIYIADAYGVFSFRYTPDSYDQGYMKWQLRKNINNTQVYGLCINKGFLYVSDSNGCWAMRLYDTGIDGYTDEYPGVLISREYEGEEGGTITKMLDEIRLNYELNPVSNHNGDIDIYVSPNNLWTSTSIFDKEHNRWHVMHIEQRDIGSRTQKTNLVNSLQNGKSAFKFDRQTITYAIVITKPTGSEPKATPIVRQLDIKYHCKDKVNNIYNIN